MLLERFQARHTEHRVKAPTVDRHRAVRIKINGWGQIVVLITLIAF
jgi:hypothetical protein